MRYESRYQACRSEPDPKKREGCHHHTLQRDCAARCCVKRFWALRKRGPRNMKRALLHLWRYSSFHPFIHGLCVFSLIHADQTAQNSVLLINACITIMWFVCISQNYKHNSNHLHIIGCDRTIWWYKFIKLPFNSEDWPLALSIWMVILQLLSYLAEILHTILTEPHRVWFDSSVEALKNDRTSILHLCP